MADYCLSCCSPVDLTKELLAERNIEWISFHYELDGVQYVDDFWTTMTPSEMYGRMIGGASSKTSQVGVGEYVQHFRRMLSQGKDVLHCSLSSGISGTYNSACAAADMLREEFPDRKLYIVDSLCASGGFGLLMIRLADLRDGGMGIDELYQWALDHRKESIHWFFSTDLTFFIRGGRVSKTAGFFGTVLNICPLLNVNSEGKLVPREKVRTKKKVYLRIVEKMEADAANGKDYDDNCFICHSDCLADASAVAALIEERFPKMKGKVKIFNIGSMIGSHTGPGTVAMFYWGSDRVD